MIQGFDDDKLNLFSLEECNREQIKNNILKLNEKTKENDLILTEEQVENLIEVRKDALINNGLVEFDTNVINDIILAFYGSPYLSKFDYDETLYELVEVFYNLRKEFNYRVTNDEIIDTMRNFFDGVAGGSTQMLERLVLEKILGIKQEHIVIVEDVNE